MPGRYYLIHTPEVSGNLARFTTRCATGLIGDDTRSAEEGDSVI